MVQPLFFLFVLGRLLTGIGVAASGFSVLLLPGVVAFSAFITPLQSVATDLGRDLGFTREIDDRLLAPLTYAAEGLRWATMPPPHVITLPPGLVLAVLCASLAASLAVGLCQFRHRVLR